MWANLSKVFCFCSYATQKTLQRNINLTENIPQRSERSYQHLFCAINLPVTQSQARVEEIIKIYFKILQKRQLHASRLWI